MDNQPDILTLSDMAKEHHVPIRKILDWCEIGYLKYHKDKDGNIYFIKNENK